MTRLWRTLRRGLITVAALAAVILIAAVIAAGFIDHDTLAQIKNFAHGGWKKIVTSLLALIVGFWFFDQIFFNNDDPDGPRGPDGGAR